MKRLAAQFMGREPLNEIGQCFETAIRQACFAPDANESIRLCHGLGVANAPGQEGLVMGHAWVELVDPIKGKLAFDTTWGTVQPAEQYRLGGKVFYVVEYTREVALCLWKLHNYPGPWDLRIKSEMK